MQNKFKLFFILLFLLSAHSFCSEASCGGLEFAPTLGGPISERIQTNLEKAQFFSQHGNFGAAIEFLDKIVNTTFVLPVEKVHYLIAISNFHLGIQDVKGYREDMEKLKNLCLNDPVCNAELWTHYEYAFLYHHK